MIALDCGVKAIEQVAYAKTLGIELIICDHHTPSAKPPHICLVNGDLIIAWCYVTLVGKNPKLEQT